MAFIILLFLLYNKVNKNYKVSLYLFFSHRDFTEMEDLCLVLRLVILFVSIPELIVIIMHLFLFTFYLYVLTIHAVHPKYV